MNLDTLTLYASGREHKLPTMFSYVMYSREFLKTHIEFRVYCMENTINTVMHEEVNALPVYYPLFEGLGEIHHER